MRFISHWDSRLAEARRTRCRHVMDSFLYSMAASRASIASSSWNKIRSSCQGRAAVTRGQRVCSLSPCPNFPSHLNSAGKKLGCAQFGDVGEHLLTIPCSGLYFSLTTSCSCKQSRPAQEEVPLGTAGCPDAACCRAPTSV